MSLILPGNSTANVFTQATGQTTNGETKYAHLLKFKRIAHAGGTGGTNILRYGTTFVGRCGVTFAETGLSSAIRTSGQNTTTTVLADGLLVNGTTYTIASTIDLTAGELKHYLDGSQVGETIDVTGHTLMVTSAQLELRGSAIDGTDYEIIEAAIWRGSIPSAEDLAAYHAGTKTLSQFDNPPTARYAPTGDGSYISTLTDLSGSNNMSHTAGPNNGDNAPTATGAVPPGSYSLAITSVGGVEMTSSGTYFVGRDKTSGVGSVALAGTYTGDQPTAIEARAAGGPWTTIDPSPSDGTWAGTLNNIPAGVTLEVRPTDDIEAVVTMTNFGCGDFVVIAGQSNAEGVVSASGRSWPEGAQMFRVNTTTGGFTRPNPGGDYHLSLAAALVSRKTGVPMCICNVAIGGTAISTWQPGASSWVTASDRITAANVPASNAPVMIWWQGESDAGMSAADYKAALTAVVDAARTTWGISKTFVIPIIYKSGREGVINGTIQAANEHAHIYPGAYIGDIREGVDNLHVTSADEAEIIAARVAESLLVHHYGEIGFSGALDVEEAVAAQFAADQAAVAAAAGQFRGTILGITGTQAKHIGPR